MNQFFLFLLSGGLAAFFNWSSRFFFSIWFSFEFSIIAAFFIGLISGFLMMRWFVFDGKSKPVIPQAARYIFVNFFALAQTLCISILLAKWVFPLIGFAEYTEGIAHMVGVLVPVVTSYFGHKFLTFR